MNARKIAVILSANLLYAFGSAYFLLPSGMVSGGITGLAIGLNNGFGIPRDLTVWVLQVALFLAGWLIVGRQFALTTLVSSFAYPALFSVMIRVAERTGPLTGDPFLCMIFAGLLFGVGIGMVLRQGASTGGTDIIAVILNKSSVCPFRPSCTSPTRWCF